MFYPDVDFNRIARTCLSDFIESHGGTQPSSDEMRTMIQQDTGIDVGENRSRELLHSALDVQWCDGCGCEHGPGVCHWR